MKQNSISVHTFTSLLHLLWITCMLGVANKFKIRIYFFHACVRCEIQRCTKNMRALFHNHAVCVQTASK